MLRLTEPEDLPTEEYDHNYSEDLGDDLLGVTPPPNLIDPITHAIIRIASALSFMQ
jgi:hypothetical protein